MKTINSYEDIDIYIFTDGSATEGTQMGGAGIVAFTRASEEECWSNCAPAGKVCSSFDAESIAMLNALTWINNQEDSNKKYLICTDSKAVTETLRNSTTKNTSIWIDKIIKELAKTETKIFSQWIPSHCDIPGNDKADTKAAAAAKLNQTDVTITYDAAIAYHKRRKWQVNNERAKKI